ncbi:hypothetical protein POPTR_006G120750v4 [Populus trichocarpa]|uniref:Uncharacterized protein n=1 Tax=Populus trichocarpa TaxID=3694 RepID=A0ACC0STS2_POPTR|nr:hypothetical protein POPTR_006G120750v4 [Populus trichocarpa]
MTFLNFSQLPKTNTLNFPAWCSYRIVFDYLCPAATLHGWVTPIVQESTSKHSEPYQSCNLNLTQQTAFNKTATGSFTSINYISQNLDTVSSWQR